MSQDKEQFGDEVMNLVVKKLNDKKYNAEGWGQTIQLVFNDIAKCYKMKFAMDGAVSIEKIPAAQMKEADAISTVTFDKVETWKGVVDGEINPMDAIDSGSMVLGGDMNALYKLMPAIG